MTSTAQGLYPVLFPASLVQSQEFWNKNFPIIENGSDGYAVYLGTLSALLQERLFFFKREPNRSNGLQLVLVCTLVWQLIRGFAGMEGDDVEAFRKKTKITSDPIFEGAYGDDVLPFLKAMNRVHKIHSFIRHPQSEFSSYKWVLSSEWPKEEAAELSGAADDLRTVLVFLMNDCSQRSGWVGDKTKTILHENAKLANEG
jgi:hypothetical protein